MTGNVQRRPTTTEGAAGAASARRLAEEPDGSAFSGRALKRLGIGADGRARGAAARLGDVATQSRLLDVAFATTDSPIGPLLVATTPRGVARVAFDGEPRDAVLEELARRLSPRLLESASATDELRRELDEYFDHRRRSFDVRVDFSLVRGFARPTLLAAARVPYGAVTTYRDLAVEVGSPRAARAIGNALGSNPIPVIVPCHRVLRSGGALGGYGGGLERKTMLLRLEGALGRTA
jgi:methylated-DNA-[protein]-cysteine S-methyltransferase